MLKTLVLLSTDPRPHRISPKEFQEMQTMCMQRLLDVESRDALGDFANAHKLVSEHFLTSDRPCEWRGVQCVNQKIEKIRWDDGINFDAVEGMKGSRLHLEWLPPTLKVVRMDGMPLKQQLRTRMLPRGLQDMDLRRCQLRGSLRVETLPPAMESAQLTRNKFYGVIRLTALPPKLRMLTLHGNNFHTAVVLNEALPASLQSVVLYMANLGLKRPKVVVLDGEVADWRVKT